MGCEIAHAGLRSASQSPSCPFCSTADSSPFFQLLTASAAAEPLRLASERRALPPTVIPENATASTKETGVELAPLVPRDLAEKNE